MADCDDFGLSSGDEADILEVEKSSATTLKRKINEYNGNAAKRMRQKEPSNNARTLANKVLKERFGLDAFRLKQETAIARLLDGDSSVVIFPTGGGKSLCYQVPALCFKELDRQAGVRPAAEGGITLVVSPLIALMKDQVDALQRRGISAAVLNSSNSRDDYMAVVDSMRNGALDIVYCAPERLNNEGFVSSMKNVRGGVRLLAVDEAHCISEWGHAFRPDYLKVARFAREINAERVVCLTATATQQVTEDVRRAFHVTEDGVFRTTTYRPNLRLHAESYQTKAESYPRLRKFLQARPGSSIVYVTTHKQAESVAEQLRKHGFKTRHFHAGMKPDEKLQCQEAFMRANDLIIVATIAFGMGIDKANIRNVVHYDIPRSLEGYSQEIGRAGRDGLESHCMLYLCAEDLHIRESFARGDLPSKPSVQRLLREVLSSVPTRSPESHIEASLFHMSKEFDIRPTVLGNIFAQLELRFELLRATTPKYTQYSYTYVENLEWDKSATASAIRNSSHKKSKLTHVDIDVACMRHGATRMEVVSKLNHWNDEGFIELRTGGVINLFRVLKQWPPSLDEQARITDELYQDLEYREQQELQRMDEVTKLITGTSCFAQTLAAHFGDSLPDGAKECGHCTWCETRLSVPMVKSPQRPWDSKKFARILQACPDRDDPRYLARIAFGISSPRITAAKMVNNPVFESMADQDFTTLLDAFTKACHK
ncbi:hypothetical protein DOTSEDRAFT_133323 [Dothistroma septosporum NZE10]|uniref:ATP-dependent DNA helicase n=1 Tax=Dothistroma septosporum (strain NZE10 / CBS 128990) TaxID=675120 RepID=N1PMG0_DOTSN|nr:hypothetical protein DOTSEDRAFT_133323 [Dothistroma septosporum NZE10]